MDKYIISVRNTTNGKYENVEEYTQHI